MSGRKWYFRPRYFRMGVSNNCCDNFCNCNSIARAGGRHGMRWLDRRDCYVVSRPPHYRMVVGYNYCSNFCNRKSIAGAGGRYGMCWLDRWESYVV
jgi:hypothetical protein